MVEKKGKAQQGKETTTTAKKPRIDTPGKVAALKNPVGARKKSATFTLNAPQATRVFVAGCFNGWDPTCNPLQKNKAGLWKCTVDLEQGRHEYRFVVDDVWSDDPANSIRSQNEFGTQNCVIMVE